MAGFGRSWVPTEPQRRSQERLFFSAPQRHACWVNPAHLVGDQDEREQRNGQAHAQRQRTHHPVALGLAVAAILQHGAAGKGQGHHNGHQGQQKDDLHALDDGRLSFAETTG